MGHKFKFPSLIPGALFKRSRPLVNQIRWQHHQHLQTPNRLRTQDLGYKREPKLDLLKLKLRFLKDANKLDDNNNDNNDDDDGRDDDYDCDDKTTTTTTTCSRYSKSSTSQQSGAEYGSRMTNCYTNISGESSSADPSYGRCSSISPGSTPLTVSYKASGILRGSAVTDGAFSACTTRMWSSDARPNTAAGAISSAGGMTSAGVDSYSRYDTETVFSCPYSASTNRSRSGVTTRTTKRGVNGVRGGDGGREAGSGGESSHRSSYQRTCSNDLLNVLTIDDDLLQRKSGRLSGDRRWSRDSRVPRDVSLSFFHFSLSRDDVISISNKPSGVTIWT